MILAYVETAMGLGSKMELCLCRGRAIESPQVMRREQRVDGRRAAQARYS